MNNNISTNTIAAIATPPGYSGIGIIRVSGSLSTTVAQHLLGKLPKPRKAEYLEFLDSKGFMLDKGIAIFFPQPNSFTGEDILELHGHGSPIMLNILLQRILELPEIYIANPGEFSKRAFLNKKIDLIQAEAIIDLINSSSEQAARSAVNSLQGLFSKNIHILIEKVDHLRVYIEASIDFPEENIISLSNKNIHDNIIDIKQNIYKVYQESLYSSNFHKGKRIVIAGNPNVGKSSLINALLGYELSIVSNIPGTTRDVLCESINIDGIPISIIDTAGLRNSSDDEVENIGINKAWKEIKKADHILFVIDNNSNYLSHKEINTVLLPKDIIDISKNIPITIVQNKSDLIKKNIEKSKKINFKFINVSAKFGFGIDNLRKYIKNIVKSINHDEGIFLARQRHIQSLKKAMQHITFCENQIHLPYNYELLAEELKLIKQSLNEIIGNYNSSDLLEKIFSKFCIGK